MENFPNFHSLSLSLILGNDSARSAAAEGSDRSDVYSPLGVYGLRAWPGGKYLQVSELTHIGHPAHLFFFL